MRILLLLLLLPATSQAEQFDFYTNTVLARAIEAGTLKEVKALNGDILSEFSGVLSDTSTTFLIIETNDKRFAKLLVRPAGQKIGADQQIGMLLIEKFTTFREATEKAIKASGQNVNLYSGMRFHLDLGQVVPEKLGGDLIVEETPNDPLNIIVKPVGKARIFILTKPIPDVVPKKAPKLVVGEKFETRFFAGKYKLYDDGRRSGALTIEVTPEGEVTGSFYSDKDGQKYEVKGKVGNPQHAINFVIKYPQTEQNFSGYLFTGNGKAITGTTKLADREAGFYAERVDE